MPAANSLMMASACAAAGVPFELHVYESGRHGLGLAADQPAVRGWFDLCLAFLERHLASPPAEAGVGEEAAAEPRG